MASTPSQSQVPPRSSGNSIQNSVGQQQQTQQPHLQPPAIALIIYPITIIIGSLYSLISPTARGVSPEPSPGTATAFTPQTNPNPVNYFARKNNIFNLYFVKIGWLWTTLAFLALLLAHPAYTSPRLDSSLRFRRAAQTSLRYLLVTVAWILTTQWFLGPPIIDRSFIATGGRCENPPPSGVPGQPILSELEAMLTSAACKAAGGSWKGGHDVSGHVFMLVLASASLGLEMMGATLSVLRGEGAEIKDKKEDGDQPVGDGVDDDTRTMGAAWLRKFVWTIVGLSWWMLLMTGIWFHTWLEKVWSPLIFLHLCFYPVIGHT